jgi:hypothetical protein
LSLISVTAWFILELAAESKGGEWALVKASNDVNAAHTRTTASLLAIQRRKGTLCFLVSLCPAVSIAAAFAAFAATVQLCSGLWRCCLSVSVQF